MNTKLYDEYYNYFIDPTIFLSSGESNVLRDPGQFNFEKKILYDRLDRIDRLEKIDISERYIDFKSDFGFKYLLGKPERKRLQHFILSILPDHVNVGEIDYSNNELQGRMKKNRKSQIDILSEEENGRIKIILEMQKNRQEFFVDRSVLYSGQLNSLLARKGAGWDFDTDPIITLSIVNFSIRKNDPGYIHFGRLMYEDVLDGKTEDPYMTKKQLSGYVELNKFNKKLDELETNLDKWLFLIKNLCSLSEMPEIFNDEIFRPIFESAEYSKMSEVNQMLYKSELDEQWRKNADRGGAIAQAKEDAIAEGKPIWEAKGREDAKKDMIRSLLLYRTYTSAQIAELVNVPIRMVDETKNETPGSK